MSQLKTDRASVRRVVAKKGEYSSNSSFYSESTNEQNVRELPSYIDAELRFREDNKQLTDNES